MNTYEWKLANGQVETINVCCHRCVREKGIHVPGLPDLPISAVMMLLCPECGNKRCPKASDHHLDCTESNEPGQRGSIFKAHPLS